MAATIRLRELREARGMSMDDLSRKTGLSEYTIRNLDQGDHTNPRTSTLAKLCKALGCTIGELVTFR